MPLNTGYGSETCLTGMRSPPSGLLWFSCATARRRLPDSSRIPTPASRSTPTSLALRDPIQPGIDYEQYNPLRPLSTFPYNPSMDLAYPIGKCEYPEIVSPKMRKRYIEEIS